MTSQLPAQSCDVHERWQTGGHLQTVHGCSASKDVYSHLTTATRVVSISTAGAQTQRPGRLVKRRLLVLSTSHGHTSPHTVHLVSVYDCQVRLHISLGGCVGMHQEWVVSSLPTALPPLCHSEPSRRSCASPDSRSNKDRRCLVAACALLRQSPIINRFSRFEHRI